MNKRFLGFIIIANFILVCSSAVGLAQREKKFGLGAILGAPTGITAKLWINNQNAIDGAAAWTSDGRAFFHLDYLWHDFGQFKVEKGSLPLYYGVGGNFELNKKKTKFAIRGVIGVAYLFADFPLEAFFEIAPLLQLSPCTDVELGLALGIRYLFG